MSQIGEAIAVAAVEKSDPCWYCEKEPEEKVKNNENDDPPTSDGDTADNAPENNEGNDSSQLGSNLEDRPRWTINNPLKPGEKTEIVPAAHHCIPGGASLAKASALHDFMREGGPYSLECDIGYNVNHKNNGVWLPGNYAVREGNEEFNKKTWGNQSPAFKNTYARLAMKAASGKQFHDAHPRYNGKVKNTLISIAGKLTKPDKEKCPVCDKKADKTRPPFGLVQRLDFVSDEHRKMLATPSKHVVSEGYFTSSRVKKIFGIL